MKVRLNENQEVVKTIQQGLKETGGYCPCRLARTPENKCMCQEFRGQIADPEAAASPAHRVKKGLLPGGLCQQRVPEERSVGGGIGPAKLPEKGQCLLSVFGKQPAHGFGGILAPVLVEGNQGAHRLPGGVVAAKPLQNSIGQCRTHLGVVKKPAPARLGVKAVAGGLSAVMEQRRQPQYSLRFHRVHGVGGVAPHIPAVGRGVMVVKAQHGRKLRQHREEHRRVLPQEFPGPRTGENPPELAEDPLGGYIL